MHFSLIALFTALAGAATANPAPSTSSACDVQCKFRVCSSLMLELNHFLACEDRLSADVDKCQLNFGIPTRYGQ